MCRGRVCMGKVCRGGCVEEDVGVVCGGGRVVVEGV